MKSKKHYTRKARDASPPEQGTQPSLQEQKGNPENAGTQEDVLILLAQQIQERRKPSRYLEGWIRRFVRG